MKNKWWVFWLTFMGEMGLLVASAWMALSLIDNSKVRLWNIIIPLAAAAAFKVGAEVEKERQ